LRRFRQLGKDSIVYGMGGVVGKSISVFLLPIYTRIFSPADYGTIEMMAVIVSLLTAFLGMGMDSAQSFYFFEQKKNGPPKQKIVVSAILQWRLTWGLGMVLFAGTLAPLINLWCFGGKLPWIYFAVSFAGALFTTVMSQSLEIFRLLYRPWPYVLVTMLSSMLGAGLILLCVVVFEQGIFGFFLGSATASLVVAFLGWYLVREYIDFSVWHRKWWPRLLRFGTPLMLAGLGFYVMSTADRWFIQYYHGEAALGLFAIGAKFALIMALAVETFRKAWWPIALDAMHSDDGPETFRMIARLFLGLGVAAVVYLTFMAPWLVSWLTGSSFHDAWPIVGVLAWPALFYGFFLVGSAGIWKAEKTSVLIYLMGGAALVNIALNYFLVPAMGAMGAALATALSYFVWVALSMSISEKMWKIGLPVKIIVMQVVTGVLSVVWLIQAQLSQTVPLYQIVVVTHGVAALLIYFSLDAQHRTAMIKSVLGR
jgi:O-antigen/teichoic acid export membrane protein